MIGNLRDLYRIESTQSNTALCTTLHTALTNTRFMNLRKVNKRKEQFFSALVPSGQPDSCQANLLLTTTMTETSKANNYKEVHLEDRRKFECLKCSRQVTTKHLMEKHLHTQHGLSPLKRVKKLYLVDADIPVPKRTLYRWKSSRETKGPAMPDFATHQEFLPSECPASDTSLTTDGPFQSDISVVDEELSDISVDSDTTSNGSDSSANNTSSDTCENSITDSTHVNALKILSCFQKHKLTASACKDILKTIKSVSTSDSQSLYDYNHLLSFVPSSSYKEVHYCAKCNRTFPDDKAVYRFFTENCPGLRYVGDLSQQEDSNQAVKYFMVADVKTLLSNLLKSPGIMEDLKQQKDERDDTWTDICNGKLYKDHKKTLPDSFSLTATLNTDGVNLYSSSKTELWPVFLAINELSPSIRFARENILLVGLWQGKGKPPFNTLFHCLSLEINSLMNNGIEVCIKDDQTVTVTLSVLCVTLDLPAKAGALNMTYYNGESACITCEEPGLTVKQGKGYSRSYPYREQQLRYPVRSHTNALELMNSASDKNRLKGFKGLSGLSYFQSFDMISGTVPDYMHAVLLGITKTLMCKWFSATSSGKDYFIGKQLPQVSQRLLNIKPPYHIERLPRDLEKHYANFKATEMQAFLLYYALPCLNGILSDKYIQHLALLSEAVFILLGDEITVSELQRAEKLLDEFYQSFSELYGQGSCGLNVHNVCLHMPYYVRLLGPIWAWSCFAFEDANAKLLQTVHGTGDVVRQALRNQDISIYIRSMSQSHKNTLKVTHSADNCDIIGKLKKFGKTPNAEILQALGVPNAHSINRVERVVVNGNKYYSSEYSRMKKRHCHCVLYSGGHLGLVQYFVLVLGDNKVYAVVTKLAENPASWLAGFQAGKHLLPVRITDFSDVILVDLLNCTAVFIQTEKGNEAIVAKMANKLGHAVFK